MKVMVFASESIKQKLSDFLAGEGIAVESASDGSEAVKVMGGKRFDLALVDSLVDGAGVACSCISRFFKIPVVLLVRESDAGWKRLHSLEPCGYVFEGVGGAEMAARLRALMSPQMEQTGNYLSWSWKA